MINVYKILENKWFNLPKQLRFFETHCKSNTFFRDMQTKVIKFVVT